MANIKKEDHCKIGRNMDLFHFDNVSPGIAFWHPKGTNLWNIIENYVRKSNKKYGYDEIKTPIIAKMSLWNKSGHIEKYRNNIFFVNLDNQHYVIKPMNCPTCIQYYNHSLHSYNELPIRIAEFGIVHRNEPSGALRGLLRTKSFTQDDAHIFCMESQIKYEIKKIINQSFEIYKDFGFEELFIKLALRPRNKSGTNEIWDKSEQALEKALKECEIDFEYLKEEGAFYGPKIEFHLKDSMKRYWQCGTIQLDFLMPKTLQSHYINNKSEKKTPVIIHRAILGSFERFIAILIENYAGDLPLWITPIHIVLIGINNSNNDYIKKVNKELNESNIRSTIDLRNEKIGFKIRDHTLKKIPFIGIAGKKEQNFNTISLRKKDGHTIATMSIQTLKQYFYKKIKQISNNKEKEKNY